MHVLLIAFRNLFGEKGRFIITVGGVVFSVILILILLGLYQGWQLQMSRFLNTIPVDLWVGQKGSRDTVHSISLLPRTLEDNLAAIEGASNVAPFVGRQISFELNGKDAHIFLLGMGENNGIKPYKMVAGESSLENNEVIIDMIFARSENLSVGDTISVNGVDLKITGISSGGNLLVYSYAFAPLETVRKILESDQITNYYLIQSSNAQLAKVQLGTRFPNLEITEHQKFVENNTGIIKQTFLPIIGILVVIALAIGILVIGLTIFTATIEKSKEYGVLKAVGYTSLQLFWIAFIQACIAGIIGFIAGVFLAEIIATIGTRFVGGFIVDIGIKEILSVFFITLLMSAVASFIPLRRIISIDPAQVFKA